MKVSIIIPIFNRIDIGGRNNLELCLAGLENQTNKDFEVLVMDDGSTDNPKEWLDKQSYSFPIKYHYMGENKGYRQCRARNEGVRRANKDSTAYIFLDSDVILPPHAVDKYLKEYEKNPNRVIVGMYYWGSPVETTVEDVKDFYGLFSEDRKSIPNADPHGMQGVDIRVEMFESTNVDELHWKTGTYLSTFGGNLFVPKKIFMDVAQGQMEANPKDNTDEYCGYDQFYTAPVEDGDFGLMLMRRGWAVSLDKEIHAYHAWHPRNIGKIQEVSQEQVKYLDKKYNMSVLDETKIVQREEYKL